MPDIQQILTKCELLLIVIINANVKSQQYLGELNKRILESEE